MPPYCQPSPAVFLQLASEEQMHGIREYGLSSSPCFPRLHRGAPEFGSSCRWRSLKCVVTLAPGARLQRPCPVPQHRALLSPLPSAPAQLARLLQGSLSGLREVTHSGGSGGQVAARLAHTQELCWLEGKAQQGSSF